MLHALRNELVPIIIVVALLVAALRFWLTDVALPDDLSVLLTAIVAWYFGVQTGQRAATRAINGNAPPEGAH